LVVFGLVPDANLSEVQPFYASALLQFRNLIWTGVIVAMTFDSRSLMLFDFETQKWEEIAKITLGFPNWSKSGEYVYFLHEENQPSVMRVRIRDRKLERVADLKNFRQAGFWNTWLGMAPDDSPLLLRDTGTQEIYALDWQAR
jgi:hypothetical protein